MDRPPQNSPRPLAVALVCALAVAAQGCTMFGRTGKSDAVARSEDEQIRRMSDIEDVQGPMQRFLSFGRTDKSQDRYLPGYRVKGREEFAAAEQLFLAEDYDGAEKQLKQIEKQYRRYAVREDALYLLGEIAFRRKDYRKAEDLYSGLVKDFPSTKYKDDVSRRMFTIAGTWLGFPDVLTPSEILPVSNVEDAAKTPIPQHKREGWDPTRDYALLPNLHDSSRPVFDTNGRALEALKRIWLDNPSSPLADDALMMTASHYMRAGKHEMADDYFSILRTHYPKSPHFENAFVLGSHAKLMSYQGPAYDGTRLSEAEQLKESSLRMFAQSEHRGRLEGELEKIEEARARREWERVEFYLKKDKPDAAAIYARELLRLYPETESGKQAREFLAKHNSTTPQSSGWDWNFFPRLEKVPETQPTPASPERYDGESVGRVTFTPEN